MVQGAIPERGPVVHGPPETIYSRIDEPLVLSP